MDSGDAGAVAASLRALLVEVDAGRVDATREQAAYLTGAADVLDALTDDERCT